MKKESLSDEIEESILSSEDFPFLRVEKVKEFIKETIKDIFKTFKYSEEKVELVNRLIKRAGPKLT